jgi:hypothetical protein
MIPICRLRVDGECTSTLIQHYIQFTEELCKTCPVADKVDTRPKSETEIFVAEIPPQRKKCRYRGELLRRQECKT